MEPQAKAILNSRLQEIENLIFNESLTKEVAETVLKDEPRTEAAVKNLETLVHQRHFFTEKLKEIDKV